VPTGGADTTIQEDSLQPSESLVEPGWWRRRGRPDPCTFSPKEWEALSGFWYPVAWSSEVGAEPHGATLLDEDLVIYRTSAGVVVARDLCLHRGSRLTLGWIQGDELVCGYHGWRYSTEGRCTRIPSQPADRKISPRVRLFTYPSVERYGIVWTCLSDEPKNELPHWPEAEDSSYRWLNLPHQDWATSAARQVENFLDISHFSFVHRETFGNPDRAEMEDFDVEITPSGLHYDYNYVASNPDFSGLGGAPTILRLMTYDVTLPFSVRLVIHYPEKGDGAKHAIFNSASPVSAKRMRVFFFIARNFDHAQPAEELLAWEAKIVGEDRPVVESQRPEELPLDLQEELHVQSDRMTIAYRKELTKLGLGPWYTR
jgi:phenylpropionate dioxygenase-like ring-hydroxylating dioxygenase large terminal subunit